MAVQAPGRESVDAAIGDEREALGIPLLTLVSLLVLVIAAVAGSSFQDRSGTNASDPVVVASTPGPAGSLAGRFTHRIYLVDSDELANEVWAAEARTALLLEATGGVPGHTFTVLDVSASEGRALAAQLTSLSLSGEHDFTMLALIDRRGPE
jgi:hypothetical protein